MKLQWATVLCLIGMAHAKKWADESIPLHDLGAHEDPQGGGAYLWSFDANVNGNEVWRRHLNDLHQKQQDEKGLATIQAFKNAWTNVTDHDTGNLLERRQSFQSFWKDGSYDSWYCERWSEPHSGVGSCSWGRNFVAFGDKVANNTLMKEIIRALIYRAIDHGYPGPPAHGFHSECLYYQDGPMFCVSWPVADTYYNEWGGPGWIRRYTVDHFAPSFVDVITRLAYYCYTEKSSAQIFTTDKRDEIWIMCFSDRHTGCDTMVCHPFFNVQPIEFTKHEWPDGDMCPDWSLEDWPQCKGTAPKDPDSQHKAETWKAPIGALRELEPTYIKKA